MPFRHAIVDTKSASCGPVCVSDIVGEPTSAIEGILRRAGRSATDCDTYDLAYVLDHYGFVLMRHEGFERPRPRRPAGAGDGPRTATGGGC
jgi:hypothetical protein